MSVSLHPARIQAGDSPLVATAIHDGHALRDEIERTILLDSAQRLREEDPYTAQWTAVSDSRIVGLRSRFEVDLNRPRDGAVYLTAEQAWGLEVWKAPPPADLVERSLAEYDAFYESMRRLLDEKAEQHARFVVFDIHSYNHRRDGPQAPVADRAANPEINIGTKTLKNRDHWSCVIDRAIRELSACHRPAGSLFDVRENVRFGGGELAHWVHTTYPESGCVLSIEVKKFFMDEWTEAPVPNEIAAVGRALAAAAIGVIEELQRV
jgi:N-formylglutamate amidohydrolase